MDRGQFDTLARLVSSKQSRRAAIATLLGAVLLPASKAGVLGKRKNKKRTSKLSAQAASRCYPSKNCTPGAGRDASRCDFAGSTAFFEGDFRGSNLSRSNFTGAQLARGDFRGANLSGACLVGANLQGAKLGSSVNLGGAIFCRTLMPDGTFSDRDCEKARGCCPPLPPPACEECGDACGRPSDVCNPVFAPCCPRYICTPAVDPLVLTCQVPCAVDADCRFLGEGTKCQYDIVQCTFMDRCCVVQ